MEATSRLLGIDRLLGYPAAEDQETNEEEEKFEEHFYKTQVNLVIEGEENVNGTLLLTPTSIMFDPDPNDPVVEKNGVDKYGMMCHYQIVDHVTLYQYNKQPCVQEKKEERELEVAYGDRDDYEGEMSSNFPIVFSLFKSVRDQLIPNPSWDLPEFAESSTPSLHQEDAFDITAGRLICVSLRQAMKKTFSSYDTGSNEKENSEVATGKTWFQISKKSAADIYSFFIQSTGGNDEKSQVFVPQTDGDAASAKTDELSSQLDKLSIEASSISVEWQVKRQHSSESDATMTSSAASSSSCCDNDARVKAASVPDHNNSGGGGSIMDDFDEYDDLPELVDKSELLTTNHVRLLNEQLPARAIGYPWKLSYSTNEHGMSLKTLYRNMEGYIADETPMIVVLQDQHDHLFGAYCSAHPRLSEHFYGTGESFLFRLSPDVGFYKWSGDNMFFLKGDRDSLTFGSGDGRIGLWLDENLLNGSSRPCPTFNNPALSAQVDFSIRQLEVWSFQLH